ncbi:unnamed protein product [Vicia faba]|uniref:Transmembrane protein n=1 Tax=Vicia faba TaxID=3906 RepID=A0AAV1ALX9_VICFA|nr:unnamed protein product [Vicia faba]
MEKKIRLFHNSFSQEKLTLIHSCSNFCKIILKAHINFSSLLMFYFISIIPQLAEKIINSLFLLLSSTSFFILQESHQTQKILSVHLHLQPATPARKTHQSSSIFFIVNITKSHCFKNEQQHHFNFHRSSICINNNIIFNF